MNTKNKIMTCLMLSAGGAVSLALLNKYIQFSATSRGLTREEFSLLQMAAGKYLLYKMRFRQTASVDSRSALFIERL